jgi:hypothetical protein
MGCSCRTFREEPVTRTWVGWAGPVANLSPWVPEAPPELTANSKPRPDAGLYYSSPRCPARRRSCRRPMDHPTMNTAPTKATITPMLTSR